MKDEMRREEEQFWKLRRLTRQFPPPEPIDPALLEEIC